MRRALAVAFLAIALGTGALRAQTPKPGDDPLARLLFDPQLVLKHAQDLGLQPAQRSVIINAIKEAQGDILDLQLQMAERHQELVKAMEATRVDEAASLGQADKVLGLERDMKRKQLQLLIRIKNALTREQQDRLQEWKKTEPTEGL
jgi:Spy/CpxP family protein refolding chaperone